MWTVEEIEAIPAELDFSSSGGGHRSVTAIKADGVRLINAIELVEVDQAVTQVEICEGCGYTNCAPGGWVSFRRLDQRVVWIPAFDWMSRGAWDESEYRPPSFIGSKGAPIFTSAIWDQLRKLHRGLPRCDDLPWINSREAARLCQWTAPDYLLGKFPQEPLMRRDLLVAVSEGDLTEEAGVVDACLQFHFEAADQMALLSGEIAPKPIEFWVDLPDTPGWTSFAHVAGDVCFLFEGTIALIRESESTSRIQ
jgi:hypothetical protein